MFDTSEGTVKIMNQLKTLICPGFAKCGTSSLDLTLRHDEGIVGPYGKKEFDFFAKTTSEKYDQAFRLNQRTRLRFEFSPVYSALPTKKAIVNVAMSIKKELGKTVKILFMIRNPVRRAYSHYVHEAQTGVSFGFENIFSHQRDYKYVFDKSFEELLRYDWKIRGNYLEIVELYINIFGEENVLIWSLENYIEDPWKFFSHLGDFLEIDPIKFSGTTDKILSQSPMPRYFYSIDGTEIFDGNSFKFKLRAGQAYLCSNRYAEILNDLD